MVRARFIVHYYELEDDDGLRKRLRGYFTLFSPDVTVLTDALLQVSYTSPKITVVNTPKAIYVAPGEYEIEGKAYEFLVSSESGLRKVAEEILGAEKRFTLDTVANVLQAALWGLVVLLGYFGYKNDALRDVSSYMMVFIVLSWVIENFRKGYKKRVRPGSSAPSRGAAK